jgi:large subunit ribosomal protein LP0
MVVEDITFKEADTVKAFLANPSDITAVAPGAAATAPAAAAKAAPPPKEESEEENDDMGFGLFD